MDKDKLKKIEARNKKTVLIVFGVIVGMTLMSYASVPLYSLFCQVTGFAGTTGTGVAEARETLDRQMTIRFRTTTSDDMPWDFKPETDKMVLNVGEDGFINFIAHNPTSEPVAGTAIYNVTPLKVGRYFKKIQCFCFEDQILTPGQSVNMPVLFYIDPKIAEDANLRDVKTITLSYTFFRKDSEALENAIEAPDDISG
jgi:cytochrome c oxidase assembly protein subunit 11